MKILWPVGGALPPLVLLEHGQGVGRDHPLGRQPVRRLGDKENVLFFDQLKIIKNYNKYKSAYFGLCPLLDDTEHGAAHRLAGVVEYTDLWGGER